MGNEIIQFPSGSVSLPEIILRPYPLANFIAVFKQVKLKYSLYSFAPVADLGLELILLKILKTWIVNLID